MVDYNVQMNYESPVCEYMPLYCPPVSADIGWTCSWPQTLPLTSKLFHTHT